MKTIYLVRHAKSDWSGPIERDHDRPLAPRGVEAATRMGAWLAATDAPPQKVVSSTARRTRETVRLMLDAAGWSVPVTYSSALYETDGERYLEVLRALPKRVGRVMLVGHEPACSECVGLLIGGGGVRFATTTIARIDLACATWEAIQPGAGELYWLMPARFRPVDPIGD
ncbi:MAG: histidine phosphatase family protein [Rhodothermales bacterium]|nr:histidine phosphatase family protein [Rhodothermales bacterium]